MLPETTAHVATFAAVYVALYVAHHVADHWIQTQHQADFKGRPGWPGRIACATHVTTYTLAALAALAALALTIGLDIRPGNLAAGLAVSAVTHYIADRRTPLKWFAELVGVGGMVTHCTVVRKPGEGAKDTGPGTGLYALDQSFHYLFLFVAAVVIAA